MKVSPFYEVVANAESKMRQGWTIFEQFNCAKCGAKQTMPDANVFHKKGRCEKCGHVTDIEKDGANFMATYSGFGTDISDILAAFMKEKE